MDIRRSGLWSRLFWSILIIICSWRVWTYGEQVYTVQLNAATIIAILSLWFFRNLPIQKPVCRSTCSYVLGYLILLLCTWGLVLGFVLCRTPSKEICDSIAKTIKENPDVISKTLLIAASYLGSILNILEYKVQKNPHNITTIIATTFFL